MPPTHYAATPLYPLLGFRVRVRIRIRIRVRVRVGVKFRVKVRVRVKDRVRVRVRVGGIADRCHSSIALYDIRSVWGNLSLICSTKRR